MSARRANSEGTPRARWTSRCRLRAVPRSGLSLVRDLVYTGKDHFHHRPQPVLGNRALTVSIILLLNVCLGLAALARRRTDLAGALALLLQAMAVLTPITLLERRGRGLASG